MRATMGWVLAAALLLLAPRVARADWPMARHDPRRTAESSGTAMLAQPVQSWSRYLGGSVGTHQMFAGDVNGDRVVEAVFITGGKLVAKRSDDSLVWETAPLGLHSIAAVEDFNGDGELDIVAVGFPGLVAIFGGRDGRLEWRTAYDTFGTSIGSVRVGDFNNDRRPDLYVSDNACGSLRSRGDIAWAYTFGMGFGSGAEDDATRLWQLERGRDYICGGADVVADFTGDGRPDVVTFSINQAWIYDGATGRKISSGNDAAPAYGAYPLGFSVPYGVLAADVVDLDGDGRNEIVGYTNNSYAPSINSRAVFVIAYDPARPRGERLHVRWRYGVPDLSTDRHLFVTNGAADLDRDGRLEVVSTFDVLGSGPTTYVYSGADGQILARIPGATIMGIYDLASDQPRTLLVARGPDLEGYRFTSFAGAPDGGMTPMRPTFTIPNARPVTVGDEARRRRTNGVNVQATLPEADPMRRAILVTSESRLQLWSAAGATATRLAEYNLGDLSVVAVAPQTDIERPGPGLLLARSDGYLLVLGRDLAVLNLGTEEIPQAGIRIGGFYSGGCASLSAPVAARFGGRGDAVFMTDSQRSLLRLDASAASRVVPPRVEWRWPGAVYPNLVDADGDGSRDVIALTDTRRPGDFRTLNARRADGTTTLWSLTVGMRASEQFSGDVVPLAGTMGGLRFAAQTIDPGNGEGRAYAVTPRGDRAWAASPIVTAGSGQGQLSALDVDGDGRDDAMLSMAAVLTVYSGASGDVLARGAIVHPQMPIITRGRVPMVDLITSGAHSSIDAVAFERGMSMPPYNITQRWQLPTAQYPGGTFTNCYGAIVQCPGGGTRFVNAVAGSSRLVVANAASGAVAFDVALVGGRVFPTEDAARRSPFVPGVLGNVTTIRSLSGMGGAPAALVGSTDGYLYAIDPCGASASLTWAMNFRAPVGEAVFADTDGDGSDEIVVSVADGFVYGVDTEFFRAPMSVLDIDPPRGITGMDVDEVRGSALYVEWTPVPMARGYEYALFTAGGTAVTRRAGEPTNPFIAVDPGEMRATVGEGLVSGQRYFFAVRALGAGGVASPETVSDGVRFVREVMALDGGADVVDAMAPDTGAADGGGGDAGADVGVDAAVDVASERPGMPPRMAGGCGCAVPGAGGARSPGAALLAAAVAAALAARRRARRA